MSHLFILTKLNILLDNDKNIIDNDSDKSQKEDKIND